MPEQSPAEKLKEFQKKLDEAQATNSALAKEIESLKGVVAELSKTVSEIEQKEEAWEKSRKAADDARKAAEGYVKANKPMLEAVLPNKEALIKAKVDGEKKLAELAKQLEAASYALATAETAHANAKKDTASKQAAYTALVNLAGANEAVIKDLGNLTNAAEKEEKAGKNARRYVILLFMEDVVKKLDLRTVAEYLAALNNTGSAASAAVQAERTAKDAVDAAKTQRQQAQKNLDEGRAKWRDDVLNGLPQDAPPPVVAAPAPV